MEHSRTLATAQIHFIDDRVSLIHIPLESYATYVQPLLQLIFPITGDDSNPKGQSNGFLHFSPWANQHLFLNVSITPLECSIVCSKELAQKYFAPIISKLSYSQSSNDNSIATIHPEDFVVISVEGEGLEAGQRVLELTIPLAMAGISIFFITTYFSDYILFPAKSRGQVIRALEERGFVFEKSAEAFVKVAAHHRNASSTSSFDAYPPSTPPPTTVNELQARTFSLLRRRNIFPQVHRDIRLVQCAGRRESLDNLPHSLALQIGLTKCIAHPPRFLSLTLTDTEAASILLETCSLSRFISKDVLLGNKEAYLIPITLNLHALPVESTGIVCGVAGKLVGEKTGGQVVGAIEMSYLSTVRAGTVMVDENDLDRAIEALNCGEFGLAVHDDGE